MMWQLTDLEKAGWHGSSWHALTGRHPSHHRTGGCCCTLGRGREGGKTATLQAINTLHVIDSPSTSTDHSRAKGCGWRSVQNTGLKLVPFFHYNGSRGWFRTDSTQENQLLFHCSRATPVSHYIHQLRFSAVIGTHGY